MPEIFKNKNHHIVAVCLCTRRSYRGPGFVEIFKKFPSQQGGIKIPVNVLQTKMKSSNEIF